MADNVIRPLFQPDLDTSKFDAGIDKVIAGMGTAQTATKGFSAQTHEARSALIELAKANGSAAESTKIFAQLHESLTSQIGGGLSRLRELRKETQIYSDIAQQAGFNTPIGAAAAENARNAANELRKLNSEMKLVTSNTAGLQFASSYVKGIAGGFEAAAGAATLFGAKNETVEATLKRLNGIMLTVNGVTEVMNSLRGETGLIAEATVLKEQLLAKIEQQRLLRTGAITKATQAGNIIDVAGNTIREVKIGQTYALATGEQFEAVAATEAATATGILGAAIEFALGPWGLAIIALGAIYLIYQSVTGATKEYTKALEENGKENQKFNDGIRKSADEIAAQQDKIDVLNGTITEHTAKQNEARRKFNDEGARINKEYLERVKKTNEQAEEGGFKSEEDKNKRLQEIQKQFEKENVDNQLKFANTRNIVAKEQINKSNEEAEKAAKKAAEDARKLSAEQRKLAFDEAMFAIGKQQDAELSAAKGSEELILKANIEADTKRLELIESYSKQEIALTKKGSIERAKAVDEGAKRDYEAQKKVNEDTTKLDELYRKQLIKLNTEYDKLVADNTKAGYQKDVSQINQKYTALIAAEEEGLKSQNAAVKAAAERNVGQLKTNQSNDLDAAANKENVRRLNIQLKSDEQLEKNAKIGFAKRVKLVEDEAQIKHDINHSSTDDAATQAQIDAEIDAEALEKKKKIEEEKKKLAKTAFETTINIAKELNDASNRNFDAQIGVQQQRVDQAKKLADRGNAEIYKHELDQLEKLNKQKQAQADRAAAIAEIQVVANSAIAISEQATYPFPYNAIAIAGTIAALVAGLAKAKSLGAGFSEGGWTGDQAPNQVAGVVHGQEIVIKSSVAKPNRDVLLAVNEGRVSSAKLQGLLDDNSRDAQMPLITAQIAQQAQGGMYVTKSELEEVMDRHAKKLAQSMPPTQLLNITEKGLTHVVTNTMHNQETINKMARVGKG